MISSLHLTSNTPIHSTRSGKEYYIHIGKAKVFATPEETSATFWVNWLRKVSLATSKSVRNGLKIRVDTKIKVKPLTNGKPAIYFNKQPLLGFTSYSHAYAYAVRFKELQYHMRHATYHAPKLGDQFWLKVLAMEETAKGEEHIT